MFVSLLGKVKVCKSLKIKHLTPGRWRSILKKEQTADPKRRGDHTSFRPKIFQISFFSQTI